MKKIFGGKWRSFFLLLILFRLSLLLTGCGDNTNKLHKIVVGIDDEFPPLGFHNEQNELVGFDVDLAKEVAERLGIEVEFKSIDWSKNREELYSGSIDLIWNGLDITEERKEYMLFSKPYMDDRQILLVRKDGSRDFHSAHDLEGKIVGVQAGATSEAYLKSDKNLKDSFKALKIYGKFQDAIDGLKDGEVDAFICDELVARYEMSMHPDRLEIVNVKIGNTVEMGIGFRKGDTKLRDRVQEVFDEMIADGTAKEISEKWFQADLIKLQ